MNTMHPAVRSAICERINDLMNYMCHVELFPAQLHSDQSIATELSHAKQQIAELRAQFVASTMS
ncbi:hypothetical protein [Bradyrhizobium sp.]|uniref:hypothetical protein n=1 Tax=Bradyrhizobium sp. TaxID=376 RepID=UPI003C54C466